MNHVRGAPCHPQTQGKVERWHQTLKNRILLENYFLSGDLEKQIEVFVDHYNHRRYPEKPDISRSLLRARAINTGKETKDQTKHRNSRNVVCIINDRPHNMKTMGKTLA